MESEPKKIYVTHVNIRLSISLLLLKLIAVEGMAGVMLALSQIALFLYVTNVQTFHTIIGFGIPAIIILVTVKTLITLFVILQWLNEYYEISASFIQYRRGLIFRKLDNYPTEDIKFIEVQQGLFGRMFNFGTITLMNIRRVKYVEMYLIHNPLRYAQVIEEVVPHLVERKNVIRRHYHEARDNEAEADYSFAGGKTI